MTKRVNYHHTAHFSSHIKLKEKTSCQKIIMGEIKVKEQMSRVSVIQWLTHYTTMWPYRWEKWKIKVPRVLGPLITAPARFHYSDVSSETVRIWVPSGLNLKLNYHQPHLKSEHHNFSSGVRNKINPSWLDGCEGNSDTGTGLVQFWDVFSKNIVS